jgi:hypothetical protein
MHFDVQFMDLKERQGFTQEEFMDVTNFLLSNRALSSLSHPQFVLHIADSSADSLFSAC